MGEYDTILDLISKGIDYLHVRKDGDPTLCSNMLNRLPKELRSKIRVHEHGTIAEKYGVHGIHLKDGQNIPETELVLGQSFHKLEQLEKPDSRLSYCFFAPVFDSISKKNHSPNYTLEELSKAVTSCPIPVYALGGISANNVDQLKGLGFKGVVLLGAVWNEIMHFKIKKNFEAIQTSCKNL